MYLSRVEIDVLNRKKTKDLSHLGAYHNWVESSFPKEDRSQNNSRKLWRIDSLYGKKYLLLLSEERPDIDKLERYGVPGTAMTKSYDRLLRSVNDGESYYFRLTANPSYAINNKEGKKSRKVPHITVKQQMGYLLKKSEKNGFLLNENDFTIVERKFSILKKSGQRAVNLSIVTFEGVLTVSDKELFTNALIKGIGREKAYGCGLLTIIKR